VSALWAEMVGGDGSPYRVLGVERHLLGEAVVLRRADGLELRSYWTEVRLVARRPA
jgi:hypothetical protein